MWGWRFTGGDIGMGCMARSENGRGTMGAHSGLTWGNIFHKTSCCCRWMGFVGASTHLVIGTRVITRPWASYSLIDTFPVSLDEVVLDLASWTVLDSSLRWILIQKLRSQMGILKGIEINQNSFMRFIKSEKTKSDVQWLSVPYLPLFSIPYSIDRDYLERLVTHEEIKEAVWDCGSSKAPGPDGFSFAFVKKYWDII
ncbi:hypothetical protein Tco_0692067 [Tanacetum coccineum]